MVSNQKAIESAIPINLAARYLRVPARWLREEVEAGRLPGLQAGTAILIHVPTVSRALSDRAKQVVELVK